MNINLAGTPPTSAQLGAACLVEKLSIAALFLVAVATASMPVVTPSSWDITFACAAAASLVVGLYKVMHFVASEPFETAPRDARARVATWSAQNPMLETYLIGLFAQDRQITNIEHDAIRAYVTGLAWKRTTPFAVSQ